MKFTAFTPPGKLLKHSFILLTQKFTFSSAISNNNWDDNSCEISKFLIERKIVLFTAFFESEFTNKFNSMVNMNVSSLFEGVLINVINWNYKK